MNLIGSKVLETERLILRPQTMEEQKRLWEILMIPEVNRYYLVTPKKFRKKLENWELQKAFYEEKMKHANDDDVFEWSIFLKENNECIGKIDAHDIDGEDLSIKDVGWYIDPDYHGKGYASEAAKAMFDYMFKEVMINEIQTGAAVINPASWKIMEKFGFKRLEDTEYVNYTFLDEPALVYKYNITREDYLEKW